MGGLFNDKGDRMRKLTKKLLLSSFIIIFFSSGCQHQQGIENVLQSNAGINEILESEDKMAGMKYLYSDNKNGYYFDIYSDKSKTKDRNGIIEVIKSSDELYLMIENAGKEREIAIQIFVDYIQVPIIVEGKKYFTYIVKADKNYSYEIPFQLDKELDSTINHKLLAAMTVSSDIHASSLADDRTTNVYSIAYDEILMISDKNDMFSGDLCDYEKPLKIYNDSWQGFLINDDLTSLKRKLPKKEKICKPGETIELQYHIGGYADCEEVVMVLCLDMMQIKINEREFLKIRTENEGIANGIIKITVPETEGVYDLTGWVVKNPFTVNKIQFSPLDAIPRFTIIVQK